MEIETTWKLLEAQTSAGQESRRRVIPESVASVFLVLNGQSRLRTLRIELDDELGIEEFPNSVGVQVSFSGVGEQKYFLEVALLSDMYKDIFDVLVDDLIRTAEAAKARDLVGGAIAKRILHWQSFFKIKNEGLSKERVRGLYGELKVLCWIAEHMNWDEAFTSWVGPKGQAQDFHLGSMAFEVKASNAKNPQEITISSERQLDPVGLSELVLWHYSFDERLDSGETIVELIQGIRGSSASSLKAEEFEFALRLSGYFDEHAGKYQQGFTIRKLATFDVIEGFPRIIESDCPTGLGDVKYSIQLGAIANFEIDQRAVEERISNVEN